MARPSAGRLAESAMATEMVPGPVVKGIVTRTPMQQAADPAAPPAAATATMPSSGQKRARTMA